MAVYRVRDEPISQGDVFHDVPYFVPLPDGDLARLSGQVIVLTDDCECDKVVDKPAEAPPDKQLVSVAPIHRMSVFTGGLDGDVRDGRVYRYFPLPGEGPYEECCVDLVLAQPVSVSMLLARTKVVSLTDEYRGRLLFGIRQYQDRKAEAEAPASASAEEEPIG